VIRFGPAGWSYPDSPGHVYPAGVPARFDALRFLAAYFDVIEVNSTFYRPQPARTFASWVKRVAHNPQFRFTVKLWQRFTHERGPAWTVEEVRQVTDGLQVLRDEGKLGALLSQFPWSFKPGAAGRDVLARLADAFREWPLVVEVRHGGWGTPEELGGLRDLGVGIANIDQPLIGQSLTPAAHATSAVGYVRFHGRNYEHWFGEQDDAAQRYDYLYSAKELAPWVDRIRALAAADGVADVYVISNNHFEGKGPANALMLRAMVERKKAKAPPVLFATYRHELEPWTEPADEPADDEMRLL
jgi:uncharacterized protein YecE (DUF72 family)